MTPRQLDLFVPLASDGPDACHALCRELDRRHARVRRLLRHAYATAPATRLGRLRAHHADEQRVALAAAAACVAAALDAAAPPVPPRRPGAAARMLHRRAAAARADAAQAAADAFDGHLHAVAAWCAAA